VISIFLDIKIKTLSLNEGINIMVQV